MSSLREQFLETLAAFAGGRAPIYDEVPDWRKLILPARKQSVSGIVAYMAVTHCGDTLSVELRNRLNEEIVQTVSRQTARNFAFERVRSRLEAQGVRVIPLKGMIWQRYYPIPELRTFGDVDMLIPEDKAMVADRLMRDMGYTYLVENGAVRNYSAPNEYYELHTNPVSTFFYGPVDLPTYFSHAWEHLTPDGRELTPEFHLLFMIVHLAKHLYDRGAGVRLFLDIALAVPAFSAEQWQTVRTELVRMELDLFFGQVLNLCKRWFGISEPYDLPPMDEELYEEYTEYVLASNTFGTDREFGTAYLRKQYEAAGAADDRAYKVGVWRYLFPPLKEMKRLMPFLRKAPYLLPFAWVARAFRAVFFRRKAATIRMKEVLSNDAEARRQYALYSRIGLAAPPSQEEKS